MAFSKLRSKHERTQRTPAGALDETGRRVAHLPTAIIGDGSMLATISSRGELERLFWPNVDWGQHLGEMRLGIAMDGHARWLDEPPFTHTQSYVEDTNMVETTARSHGLSVEMLDFVDVGSPVLLRRVRIDQERSLRLVVYMRPELEESVRYGGAYIDPTNNVIVFYRRTFALALGMTPSPQAAVGRADGEAHSGVFRDALRGRLQPEIVEYGVVDGALVVEFEREAVVAIALAEVPAEAISRVAEVLAAPIEATISRRRKADRRRLDELPQPTIENGDVRRLYRRSQLVFDLVSDRTTGGVVAAPEMDSNFQHSGGYGFVWGRDMAFITLAYLAAGRDDLARRALQWLRRAQAPEGLWLHRHWTNAALAPSWGLHQIDETGAILFAFEAAWRELGEEKVDAELWPSVQRAADFLVAFRDPKTGLTLPSVDLWEERVAEHCYSAAAVVAGLKAAASFARRHAADREGTYLDAALSLQRAIEQELWDDGLERYLRARCMGAGRSDAAGARSDGVILRYPNRSPGEVDEPDTTIDVSLLGLSWPFGVIDPGSKRMRSTVHAIERALLVDGGGVLRYEGDVYAGGNPWVLATLWLGLWHRQVGEQDQHLRAVEYAVRSRTDTGLLPEQVTREGRPAWVVPLTWSHAMFVIATRPELALTREFSQGTSSVRAASSVDGIGSAAGERA
jgi:glucoamylase